MTPEQIRILLRSSPRSWQSGSLRPRASTSIWSGSIRGRAHCSRGLTCTQGAILIGAIASAVKASPPPIL